MRFSAAVVLSLDLRREIAQRRISPPRVASAAVSRPVNEGYKLLSARLG